MDDSEKSQQQQQPSESPSCGTSTTMTTSGKERPHFKSKKLDSHVNKAPNSDQLDLDSLSHEQLLVEAKRLQSHLTQVKNILNKQHTMTSQQPNTRQETVGNNSSNGKKPPRVERPFDFSKFNKRHVFIKFAYLGWDYQVIDLFLRD